MSAVYDYQPRARGDPRVRVMENALDLGIRMMNPERAVILKIFPFCKPSCLMRIYIVCPLLTLVYLVLKLPDWCWGSSIKRDAQVSTNRITEMRNVPFQSARLHIVGICFFCPHHEYSLHAFQGQQPAPVQPVNGIR